VGRLSEGLQVMRMLWSQERSDYSGRYYTLRDAIANPKPLQRPHPPIWIGAGGPSTLKLTARHADVWNASGAVAGSMAAAVELLRQRWPASRPVTGAEVDHATGAVRFELRERGEQLVGRLPINGILPVGARKDDTSDQSSAKQPDAAHPRAAGRPGWRPGAGWSRTRRTFGR